LPAVPPGPRPYPLSASLLRCGASASLPGEGRSVRQGDPLTPLYQGVLPAVSSSSGTNRPKLCPALDRRRAVRPHRPESPGTQDKKDEQREQQRPKPQPAVHFVPVRIAARRL